EVKVLVSGHILRRSGSFSGHSFFTSLKEWFRMTERFRRVRRIRSAIRKPGRSCAGTPNLASVRIRRPEKGRRIRRIPLTLLMTGKNLSFSGRKDCNAVKLGCKKAL